MIFFVKATSICKIYKSFIIYLIFSRCAMMLDMLTDLHDVYDEIRTDDNDDSSGLIRHQAECILQGVRSKTYKKLLDRDTCGK